MGPNLRVLRLTTVVTDNADNPDSQQIFGTTILNVPNSGQFYYGPDYLTDQARNDDSIELVNRAKLTWGSTGPTSIKGI